MSTTNSSNEKPDIEFGNVDVPQEAFDAQNIKVRISLMVRGDILDAFKERAKKEGIGYQLLMQQALADYLTKDQRIEERLARIEHELFSKHG